MNKYKVTVFDWESREASKEIIVEAHGFYIEDGALVFYVGKDNNAGSSENKESYNEWRHVTKID